MVPQQETVGETCRRVETLLGVVRQRLNDPSLDSLAACETHLQLAGELLLHVQTTMTASGAPELKALVLRTARNIRRAGEDLKMQFEYGSKYCMGLLQARLGTGYSAEGLPVLIPSRPQSSFEG